MFKGVMRKGNITVLVETWKEFYKVICYKNGKLEYVGISSNLDNMLDEIEIENF